MAEWAYWSQAVVLAANGYSPAADKNLERVVRRFLALFELDGSLARENAALGFCTVGDHSAEVRIDVIKE